MAQMKAQAKQRLVALAEMLMHQPNAMSATKGERTSLLQPMPLIVLGHPFGETLKDWRQGVPVDCGESWDKEAIHAPVA
jgi:hypothetical protein